MVHPNMATTLGIICTDAPVTPTVLQVLLRGAASKSYNCISIDGDTSTNDMVAMFANGPAASTPDQPAVDISSSAPSTDFVAFQHFLGGFMADMAELVVRDAEGASKFITIRVQGPPSYEAAHHIASVIVRSVLVKTGIHGQDPNWHGILAALGYALLDNPFAGIRELHGGAGYVEVLGSGGAGDCRRGEGEADHGKGGSGDYRGSERWLASRRHFRGDGLLGR